MRTEKSRKVEWSLHDVNLDALVHAPWNPRSKEELDEENPEMQKLIASVKARGVLPPGTDCAVAFCDVNQRKGAGLSWIVVAFGPKRVAAVVNCGGNWSEETHNNA